MASVSNSAKHSSRQEAYVIYIFHRDLRLFDNATFTAAVAEARRLHLPLVPVFVFRDQQVLDANPYRSMNSIQFMIESLDDLDRQTGGRMNFLFGPSDVEAVKHLVGAEAFSRSHVFETADYTPFALNRQAAMTKVLPNGQYHLVHDTYLTEPGTILNGSGRMFQKFTPFWNAAKAKPVAAPKGAPRSVPFAPRFAASLSLASIRRRIGLVDNPHIHVHGGRAEGLKLLRRIPRNYEAVHDIPAERTTDLSAHHHYGTVSIRETFKAASGQPALQRQLYWRDFYGHICAAFEDLYDMSPYAFQAGGHEPGWRYDRAAFNKWAKGETGVPIVDAAMRQLLQTGYMHNRARLIVANYLVKDQKIYWRWGERFFAQHLVDYDFAQNFGNWAWVASVFPWSQAPFRSLKAERQAERFDSDGEYVKRWLGIST
jgi:deoxyribodipyrimidine photo-lyase